HEVRHEVVVDDLPGRDIKKAGNDGDADADGEGFTESDLAFADVVAVRANPKEGEQHGQDDGRIADDVAVVQANLVLEGDGDGHHQGGEGAGNEAEDQNGLFHWLLLRGKQKSGGTLPHETDCCRHSFG